VVARSMTQMKRAEPVMAGALAASFAVALSKKMGFRQIIFEGDAQTIVKEVNSEDPCTKIYPASLWRGSKLN
jgi:hypothetical protein